jgi:hypothetical protein
LAWKSGLKVPLLPLGHSCPLQTILLSDLVGCDSPLQKVMAHLCNIIVSRGLSHPTQKVQFKQKGRQTAITICRGLSHPTGRAALQMQMLNERCMEEEWRPGKAKGYVLFQAPKLVQSQLLKHLFEKTCKLCSIGGGGGGVHTREVHEQKKSTN